MGRVLSAVLVAVAVVMAAFAGPVAAKPTYSATQKATIRAQLRKQIKKNPAVIKRKAFVRKAALVNFVLPVTIRIRNQCAAGTGGVATCPGSLASPQGTNGTALNEAAPPVANVNLGPTLGQRSVALGGSLAAEVQFSDSYDGGALGNVNIKLLPSTTKFLKTSSVPLLWNPDMTDPATRADVNLARAYITAGSPIAPDITGVANSTQGCSDWYSTAPGNTAIVPAGYNALFHGTQPSGFGYGAGEGIPGLPYYGSPLSTTPAGYIPLYPGVNGLDKLKSSFTVGDNDQLGPAANPFPYAPGIRPGSFPSIPTVEDTVFRTNALHLAVAPPGVTVDGATGTSLPNSPTGLSNGPSGTQGIVTGQSGGQANLFGNIPGKNDSIDVTVNLQAPINAIARVVDQDIFKVPLISGDNYPAGVFNCGQVWLGAVQNYIPGIRLRGSLRIAPAITKDGKLRIAKASVATQHDSHVALSACLFPRSAYNRYNFNLSTPGGNNLTVPALVPPPGAIGTPGQLLSGLWPANSTGLPIFFDQPFYNPSSPTFNTYGGNAPSNVQCNSPAFKLVEDAGFSGSVLPYTNTNNLAEGYTTSASGATVTVAGDISVQNLNVDVLIGNN